MAGRIPDSPFVLLDDARSGKATPARLYRDPLEIVTAHDAASIGNAVARLGAGHDLVLVFGASAIVDRGEVEVGVARDEGAQRVGCKVVGADGAQASAEAANGGSYSVN